MINLYKITLENIIQFVAVLLQIMGMFVIQPTIFSFHSDVDLFAGGNLYNFILIFITIILLYLGFTYSKRVYAAKWFITFVIFGLMFISSFFYYTNLIDQKTFIFSTEGYTATRLVKGNTYVSTIRPCVDAIVSQNPDITEIEIIKSCEDITDFSQLHKVWPQKQILQNMKLLSIWYCILITMASVAIICGLQALKCKRIEV